MKHSVACQEVVFREGTYDFVAKSFDFFPTALLAIDEDDDEGDVAAFTFNGFNGGDGGIAFGDDVIDDDDFVAGFEIPFDEFGLAVGFGSFTDDEGLEGGGGVLFEGVHAGGERDGIGTHGEAAYAGGGEVQFFGFLGDECVDDLADEGGAFGVEGGEAAIDVVGALGAGGEGEVAEENGFGAKDLKEAGLGLGKIEIRHGR